jgi:23S rRNA (uridine2552-2'-O)-methyltransferase
MQKKNKVVKAWIKRHVSDHYVHMAKKEGFRSRAAYKLEQLETEFALLHNVATIVDLGCAPGSWSQYLLRKCPKDTKIIGVDLLPIEPLHNFNFILGDFTDNAILQQLINLIGGKKVDLIISDMAPNLSGVKTVDQARGAYLVELVFDFAHNHLKTGGNCLIKVFQGGEFEQLVSQARTIFTQVVIRKPDSSRNSSAETYMVCRNKKY